MKKLSLSLIAPLFLSFVIISGSCMRNKTGQTVREDSPLVTIEFEQILNQDTVLKSSDIATTIHYVPLESKPEALFSRVHDVQISKEYFFISDFKQLYQFKRNGEFVRKIGRNGKGPGEYLYLVSLDINEELREIYIFCNVSRKVLIYDFEGNHLRSYAMPQFRALRAVGDSLFLAYTDVAVGKEEDIFTLIDAEGDSTCLVKNDFKWEHKSNMVYTVYTGNRWFYRYDGNLCFKDIYNDTLYRYNAEKQLAEPRYYFDLGKYDIPDLKRVSYIVNEDLNKYKTYCDEYYQFNVLESDAYLFIDYFNYCLRDQNRNYGIWNKSNGNLYSLVNEQGEPAQIINDFTGGMDFWVEKIDGKQLFSFVFPHELKSFYEEYPNQEVALLPEKQSGIERIVAESSSNDNPVIRILELK